MNVKQGCMKHGMHMSMTEVGGLASVAPHLCRRNSQLGLSECPAQWFQSCRDELYGAIVGGQEHC